MRVGPESGWGSIFLNLGTEIIGIVLTVALVEVLLERQSQKEVARSMAMAILIELDKRIHSWLGGDPRFDVNEMLLLL